MNRGPEKKSSSEMVTDPERLKGWINLLNSSSSDIKPVVAIIVTKDETQHFYNLPEDMHELIKFLELVQGSDRMPEKGLPRADQQSSAGAQGCE